MAWSDGLDPATSTYKIAASSKPRIRVMAGPGTGKSFAMKRRVARLLESGIDPKKVLAVTFTRVAAEDLHRELVQLGVTGCDELRGQTLHSLGLRILARAHVLQALGRTPRPINRFEEDALVCDLAPTFGGKRPVAKLLKAYNAAWAQAQGDAPGFEGNATEKSFSDAVKAWMIFHEAMLIGEIIPYLLVYLKHNPAAPELSEFEHILVDEFQDLNKAEQSIIEKLCSGGANCVVGDDDQSIYSFKFAHPDGIREWPSLNPGSEDHALDECHRCPTLVVEMANALIAHNKHRDPRSLKPIAKKGPGDVQILQFPWLEQELNFVADEVERLVKVEGVSPGDIIVLVQRGMIGARILERLRKKEIPAKSYYEESQLDTEAAQVRFAAFKLLMNRDDRVALRYLLGEGSQHLRAKPYARVRAHCEQAAISPWKALEEMSAKTLHLSHCGPLVAQFEAIQKLLSELEPHVNDLPKLIDQLFAPGDAEVAELRLLALNCLNNADDPPTAAADLFSAMMEVITQPEIPPTVDDVRLMSLHKSKGLSSPVVFIAGCIQGLLPQLPDADLSTEQKVASMEEQRRLFYVGITRVKADPPEKPGKLYLTSSLSMEFALAMQAGITANQAYGTAHVVASQFFKELGPTAPVAKAGSG